MTTPTAPTATPAAPPRLGPLVQYALLAGPLLSMIDSSIVTVAVAPIGRDLAAPLTTVQWTVSGYLLAMGAGLAGTSWLARRFGTRWLYVASMVAFTLASAACAGAPTAALLIAARVVQGLVAAPLVPMAMSMLLGNRGTTRAMSPLAGVMLFLGPALGPTVGGALIGATGWRAIFLVNVPIGGLAAWAGTRIPPRLTRARDRAARFDLPGLVLLAGGLTLLLFGIDRGGQHGWGRTGAWLPLVGGAALLAGYTAWAGRREHPALDLSLARYRTSVLALSLCAAASVVTYAAVFLLPVFVQVVQGRSALATGLAMLPQGVITGLSTTLGPRLFGRLTVRATVLIGFGVLTAASLGLLAIDAGTPLVVTATILAARAASIGLVITPLLTVLLGPLEPGRVADANTLFNIWQRIAGSFGIGLISALFTAQSHRHGPVAGLHVTAAAIIVVCAVAALAAVALPALANTGRPGD